MENQVLILSEARDRSTSDVMDWIEFLGGTCVRVNMGSKLDHFEMTLSNSGQFSIEFCLENGITLNTNKIRSCWFRRGCVEFDIEQQDFSSIKESSSSNISTQLQSDLDSLRRTVYETLTSKLSLGNPNYYNADKLTVLSVANRIGLNIPNTLVTTQDTSISQFGISQGSIITKSIAENLILSFEPDNDEQIFGLTYTEEVCASELKNGGTRFPTCVQEKLDKEFDIRVFFLDGTCYSMAIFSQLEQQTSIDFRKYNEKKNHRVSPYLIPDQISDRIATLMKLLDLNTGSLDFVLTKDGRYVFLEVNPVGQFGMVSYPCNYGLEKKIAQYLLSDEKGTNQRT